jgi:thiamine pyrophosphate-dependent acetolactate synthase large subunit-like protein
MDVRRLHVCESGLERGRRHADVVVEQSAERCGVAVVDLAGDCTEAEVARDEEPFRARKVAEGKTKREAIRALKRQISNAVYRQLLIDARRRA